MIVDFKKAKEEIGVAYFGRWLLPDGDFLDLDGNDDHRIIGIYCKNNWIEFIQEGALSLHLDPKCGYLWIRTNGLTTSQMTAMTRVIDELELNIRELKVDFYDFETWDRFNVESCILYDYLAILYLTDQIAYRCAMSAQEES
jgi:hypothetical protein